MSRDTQLTTAQRMGAALKRLRTAVGYTQERAAERAQTNQQTWQRYEAGQSNALLNVDKLERIVRAVDATPEDLRLEMARLAEPLPQRRAAASTFQHEDPFTLPLIGHVRAGPTGLNVFDAGEAANFSLADYFGADWRVLQVAGESMIPYAEPGGFVTYNLRRHPQRNKGCVIKTRTGDYYIKRYDGISDGRLHVTELFPQERQLHFDMEREIEGLYAVGIRVG